MTTRIFKSVKDCKCVESISIPYWHWDVRCPEIRAWLASSATVPTPSRITHVGAAIPSLCVFNVFLVQWTFAFTSPIRTPGRLRTIGWQGVQVRALPSSLGKASKTWGFVGSCTWKDPREKTRHGPRMPTMESPVLPHHSALLSSVVMSAWPAARYPAMLLNEINIWMVNWGRKITLLHVGKPHSIHWKPE